MACARCARQHSFFLTAFKALQLEDTTAHDAFSVRLALVYLLVVWDPFFGLSSVFSFVAYIFHFCLCHMYFMGPPFCMFYSFFSWGRAHRTRFVHGSPFRVPCLVLLFLCRFVSILGFPALPLSCVPNAPFPNAPCMEYVTTFTLKITQL